MFFCCFINPSNFTCRRYAALFTSYNMLTKNNYCVMNDSTYSSKKNSEKKRNIYPFQMSIFNKFVMWKIPQFKCHFKVAPAGLQYRAIFSPTENQCINKYYVRPYTIKLFHIAIWKIIQLNITSNVTKILSTKPEKHTFKHFSLLLMLYTLWWFIFPSYFHHQLLYYASMYNVYNIVYTVQCTYLYRYI